MQIPCSVIRNIKFNQISGRKIEVTLPVLFRFVGAKDMSGAKAGQQGKTAVSVQRGCGVASRRRRARWPGDEEKGRPCDVIDRSRGRRVTSQDGNLHGRPGAREQVRPCDEEQGKAAARRREQQGVGASSSRAAGVRHREEQQGRASSR